MPSRGLFITFEGGEGCGKSTQLQLLAERLRGVGKPVLTTREPGGTSLSEAIRALLLDHAFVEMLPTTEVLLYAAARAQHVGQVITPAVTAGQIVLCDRFLDSSLVYQGQGLGVAIADIELVNAFAIQGCKPDLTMVFDIEPELGLARCQQVGSLDRIEARTLAYHHRVRAGFLALAAQNPQRYAVISVGPEDSPSAIAARVWAIVTARFNL